MYVLDAVCLLDTDTVHIKDFKSYSKDCEKTGSFFDIQYCQFGFLMGFFNSLQKNQNYAWPRKKMLGEQQRKV